MRLLNVDTLQLEEFLPQAIPSYAILSHTWNADEATFLDFATHASIELIRDKPSFAKIQLCREQAKRDGYKYAWVDTCCIDKSSSAELSEAINSMYNWYKGASICYAYLADVNDPRSAEPRDSLFQTFTAEADRAQQDGDDSGEGVARSLLSSFRQSRWFTRGFTLQELLAPTGVIFYSCGWKKLGSKISLQKLIQEITRIDAHILSGRVSHLSQSIATRMSWASMRSTSRPEDVAYCLMGLLNVNMPLLYGEGDKAFIRLQEEIMKKTDDQSIFAWADVDTAHNPAALCGLLAPHPRCFRDSGLFQSMPEAYDTPPHAMTSKGVSISLYMRYYDEDFIAVLKCAEGYAPNRFAAIRLRRPWRGRSLFARVNATSVQRTTLQGDVQPIFVQQEPHLLANPTTPLDTDRAGPTDDWQRFLFWFWVDGPVRPGDGEHESCTDVFFVADKTRTRRRGGRHAATSEHHFSFYRVMLGHPGSMEFSLPIRPNTLALGLKILAPGNTDSVLLRIGTNDQGSVGFDVVKTIDYAMPDFDLRHPSRVDDFPFDFKLQCPPIETAQPGEAFAVKIIMSRVNQDRRAKHKKALSSLRRHESGDGSASGNASISSARDSNFRSFDSHDARKGLPLHKMKSQTLSKFLRKGDDSKGEASWDR